MIQLYQGDCLQILPTFQKEIVDILITSPPYNGRIHYSLYQDNLPWPDYYSFLDKVAKEFKRVLKEDGSLFLNIGFTPRQPWIAMKVAQIFGEYFTLQNQIIYVKSIIINNKTYGHYQPLNSQRFLNNNWEYIFHFTKIGKRKLNPQLVPYVDELNKNRWATGKGKALEGNVWYIPNETYNQNNKTKHPAIFPVALPKKCLLLHGLSNQMLVVDPFAGIFTTGLACSDLSNEQCTVNFIGIEIDPKYVEIGKKRLNI